VCAKRFQAIFWRLLLLDRILSELILHVLYSLHILCHRKDFLLFPRIARQNRFDSSDSIENCLTTPETSTCKRCNLVVLAIVAHVWFLITPFLLEWNEWTVSWHTPWCFYLLYVLQEIHAPNVPRNLHTLFLSLVHQDQAPASMHWENFHQNLAIHNLS